MNGSSPQTWITPGRVVVIPESAYEYGRGELRLRVSGVGVRFRRDDGWWIELAGRALNSDGTDRDDRPCRVTAYCAAIRTEQPPR